MWPHWRDSRGERVCATLGALHQPVHTAHAQLTKKSDTGPGIWGLMHPLRTGMHSYRCDLVDLCDRTVAMWRARWLNAELAAQEAAAKVRLSRTEL